MTDAEHIEEQSGFSWPFRRSTSDKMIAGVAAGVASALGLDATYVRAAFLTLGLAGGVGLILYFLAALIVPTDDPDDGPSVEPASRSQLIGLFLVYLATMLLLQAAGIWFGQIVWPATLVIFGLAIAVNTSGINYEQSLTGITGAEDRRRSWWLVIIGLFMMVAGLAVVIGSLEQLQTLGVLFLAVLVAIGGFAIVAGPWIWSLVEDLRTERRARIRGEEKAEMAAHLHDSVLQTLALIQRTDDPKKMVTLARSQERELRSWLYDERGADSQSLRGGLADAANRVEEAHDVPVTVVVAGECSAEGDQLRALIGAATEAMMNAAKHSGADRISVFAECGDESIDIFVTDQGRGFDPEDIDDDRRGVRDSIKARMQRHGGSASIDSEPDVGTEVHLTMTGGTS